MPLQQTSDETFCIPIWLGNNLPSFEYSRKIALTSLQKARGGRDSLRLSQLIQCNTHTPCRTTSTIQTNGYHHHFFIQIPALCFSSRYQSCCRSNQPHKLQTVLARRALLCSNWPRFSFCSCLSPMIMYLYKLLFFNTPLARMLFTSRWLSRQKDVKQLSINKSKLTVEVKHSISH